MKYSIFQIKFPSNEGEEKIYLKYAFNSLDRIDNVDLNRYEKVYDGNLETTTDDDIEILEELFTMFNINHPEDFKGRSMSTSDIVLLNNQYYYCDSYGWKKINI